MEPDQVVMGLESTDIPERPSEGGAGATAVQWPPAAESALNQPLLWPLTAHPHDNLPQITAVTDLPAPLPSSLPVVQKQSSLSRLLSDLVIDSKLETALENEVTGSTGAILHTFLRSGPAAAGKRYVRVEERWMREATLGEGAHGVVYLERLAGARTTTLRAVKEIKKSRCGELDYSRELEAIFKFSHAKVRL